MTKLYLQELVNTVNYSELPLQWRYFSTSDFSRDKELFDFQQRAIESILKTLYKYYIGFGSSKYKMRDWYKTLDSQIDNLDITTKTKDGYFDLYRKHNYTVTLKKIQKSRSKIEDVDTVSFAEFTNRLCLWMATGSGKTLVIVKLIQLLNYLMKAKLIPERPILFLAHQEQLINQLQHHIMQYNLLHSDEYIELANLRTNADTLGNDLFSHDKIRVYTYRSDLISEAEKDNQVNYENYLNNGEWYIILDEAHKGAADSIRQTYYNIMSQNGFLFNFSATFTDNIDHVTTCYEYNLSSFIKNGHGKNIYLSQKAIDEFKIQSELVEDEQKKIVLRALVVLTYIKKVSSSLKDSDLVEYHNPMLVSFVNSVNNKTGEGISGKLEADLVMLFTQIANFATGKYSGGLLKQVIDSLVKEYQTDDACLFESSNLNLDFNLLKAITFADILTHVFNSTSYATSVEVKAISSNGKELVFKLPTSEQPFALIKIGDTRKWLQDNLVNNALYQINDKTFDNTSAFARLNSKDSSINMLFGSRSFYEGWDSNRPNVIIYINIGSKDAKKFVLQSTGRGIRLEPIKHNRKRIANLLSGNIELSSKYKLIIDNNATAISAMETLFVMGTSKEALNTVFDGLTSEQEEFEILDNFEINPDTKDKLLLIPKYKLGKSYFDLLSTNNKKTYAINPKSLQMLQRYCELMSDIVLIAKLGLNLADISKFRQYINSQESFYLNDNAQFIDNPEVLLNDVIIFYNSNLFEYRNFARLEDEIVHFKKIAVNNISTQSKLIDAINIVKNSSDKKSREAQIMLEYKDNPQEMIAKIRELDNQAQREVTLDDLVIKNISTHYYVPLILSNNENINYIKHIIKTPSEVKFVIELDNFIDKLNDKFEWWMFSRIDAIDDIYIPYIDKSSIVAKFKPDFIFWLKLKHQEHYLIYFIDPKGESYTDYQLKMDGYKNIFGDKKFEHSNATKKCTVEVHCKLITSKNISNFSVGYQNCWINSLDDILNDGRTS